jgi:hypothetical protein
MSDTTIDVGTEQALNQAIETVDNALSGTYVIQFTATITEGTDTGDSLPADLYALNLQTGVSVTIDGGV